MQKFLIQTFPISLVLKAKYYLNNIKHYVIHNYTKYFSFKSKVYSSDKASEMVAECDYCVSVLPYTPYTDKFVNEKIINSMKPNMVFISMGRGTTIDEEALIKGTSYCIYSIYI